MKINGYYQEGKFIPDEARAREYYLLISRLERDDMKVLIELKKAERISDSQADLFIVVLKMVADQTGSNIKQCLDAVRHLLPTDEYFNPIPVAKQNTVQLSEFIERAIIYYNEEFNLNIHTELINGKTRVKC